jgi:nucleotide-binding universal stress UspA family protein
VEIRTILVNMDVDFYTPALLASAVKLAEQHQAVLIGLASCEAPSATLGIVGTMALEDWPSADRPQVEARLASLESEFLAAVPPTRRCGFVKLLEPPTGALIRAARGADMVMLGGQTGSERSYSRNVDASEVVLAAGRPVLIAANGTSQIPGHKILVGWKDTREARRAVSDALPFLKLATDVVIATIDEGDGLAEKISLADLVAWLDRHGVKARGDVYPAKGGPAESLADLAKWLNADLVVTGAYGHSRLREWLLGGMTSDLIGNPTVNRLMSS